ncbi:MAG: hypothetical protein KF716_08755 [Anaerolineae bacterium]|nr:hypothetical protein [Anaerolineae bacterium]
MSRHGKACAVCRLSRPIRSSSAIQHSATIRSSSIRDCGYTP